MCVVPHQGVCPQGQSSNNTACKLSKRMTQTQTTNTACTLQEKRKKAQALYCSPWVGRAYTKDACGMRRCLQPFIQATHTDAPTATAQNTAGERCKPIAPCRTQQAAWRATCHLPEPLKGPQTDGAARKAAQGPIKVAAYALTAEQHPARNVGISLARHK